MNLEHSPSRQTGGSRETGRAAYTVSEFCDAHRVSRSKLFQLWAAGVGPRFIHVGTKKIITLEAAADWRRSREQATAQ
ncbi:MAG: hypothetical protein WB760_14240 [Xanthobacteraceae bacterium]